MSTLVISAKIGRTENCTMCALKGRFTHVIRQRFLPFLSRTFPRVLKAMAQLTRSSQRTSVEERAVDWSRLLWFNFSIDRVCDKIQLGSMLKRMRKYFTGLAHCKAVSHVNNSIRVNLPQVKALGVPHDQYLSIKAQKGGGPSVFCLLKNIGIDSHFFTSKNLSVSISVARFTWFWPVMSELHGI